MNNKMNNGFDIAVDALNELAKAIIKLIEPMIEVVHVIKKLVRYLNDAISKYQQELKENQLHIMFLWTGVHKRWQKHGRFG